MSEQNKQQNKVQQNGAGTNDIQADLQAQLRLFGASVADGVANGFEDGTDAITTHAKGLGGAIVNAIEQELAEDAAPAQPAPAKANPYDYDLKKAQQANATRMQQGSAKRNWAAPAQSKPSYALASAAAQRMNVGALQVVFGAILGGAFVLATFLCAMLSAVLPGVATLFAGAIMSFGMAVASIPGVVLFLLGLGNVKFAKRIKRYVAAMDKSVQISVQDLADIGGYSRVQVLKDLRKVLQKDWCPLWLDEAHGVVYLSLEAYREAKAQWQVKQSSPAGSLLEQIDSFILVLGKQTQMMQEPEAVAELTRMQTTCRDIYDWIASHPESEQKLRRFTSYYMPTTLKLLYSYNDVQGQQGENAQNIRRDIGRFLHTLNAAFDNLHDGLLSSVSFDVSAEIAALQGILAQDGLAPDGGLSF